MCTILIINRFDLNMYFWAPIQYGYDVYQSWEFRCGDKKILRLFRLHNGTSYIGKTYLNWIRALDLVTLTCFIIIWLVGCGISNFEWIFFRFGGICYKWLVFGPILNLTTANLWHGLCSLLLWRNWSIFINAGICSLDIKIKIKLLRKLLNLKNFAIGMHYLLDILLNIGELMIWI